MLRFLVSFVGGIFSWVVTGLVFAALTVGAVFWIYSRDLPDHEYLAQYTPKTISRIYSGEGRLIDEFATERRIFAPIEDIPDLVKDAFISAEDKNFYSHQGFDTRGMAGSLWDAIRTRGQTLPAETFIVATIGPGASLPWSPPCPAPAPSSGRSPFRVSVRPS